MIYWFVVQFFQFAVQEHKIPWHFNYFKQELFAFSPCRMENSLNEIQFEEFPISTRLPSQATCCVTAASQIFLSHFITELLHRLLFTFSIINGSE